jgi:hypothetical protein
MNRLAILAIASALFTGCATARVNPYPNSHYAPSNPQNVGVYYNFPPQQYEVIGEVYYNGAPAASWTGAGKLLRQEAAKIGGDAVIVQQQDTPYVGSITTPGYINGSTYGTTMGSYSGSSYVGTYSAQSNYIYSPPTTTPLYGKQIIGIVIKFQSAQTIENAKPDQKSSSGLAARFVEASALIPQEPTEDEDLGSADAAKFEAAINTLRKIESEITPQDPAWLSRDVGQEIVYCQEHLGRMKSKPQQTAPTTITTPTNGSPAAPAD